MAQQSSSSEKAGLEEYQRLLNLLDSRQFDEAQVRGRVLLETGDPTGLVRAKTHNLLCWTFIEGLKRPSPEAVLHGEEAVRLAKALDDQSLQVQAMCNLASAYYQVGDYKSARTTYQDIITFVTTDPKLLPYGVILAYEGLAQISHVQGRPREAMTHLDAAQAQCIEKDTHCLLPDIHRRRALVYLKLNQAEQAMHELDQIDEAALVSGPRSLWWKTHLCFTRARLELAQGNPGARSLIANTLALARELGDMPVMAECTCLLALIDHAEGRKEAPKRARMALAYAIHAGRRDVLDEVRERLRLFMIHDH